MTKVIIIGAPPNSEIRETVSKCMESQDVIFCESLTDIPTEDKLVYRQKIVEILIDDKPFVTRGYRPPYKYHK